MKKFRYCPLCRTKLQSADIDGRDRLYCISCGWINYLNPIPAVACIVNDARGRTLLVKRAVEPEKGKWSLPAGFMELDEKPSQAILRELKEETGLTGRIESLIGVYTQSSRVYKSVLTIGFVVERTGGRLKPGDDVSDVDFRTIKNVRKIPFMSHRKMLKEAGF